MNRALAIKNWKDGGNNYVLKGNPKNMWVGFQEKVLNGLIEKYGSDFNIVIWCDESAEEDFYCIPFKIVQHLFVDEHKTTGKYPNRWTAIILNHHFLMHSNAQLAVDISEHYAKQLISEPGIELDNDYYIENAKGEINIRLRQSKFRKAVLKNFNYKCALTGVSESPLLIASHIVPWARKNEYRGDPSNGICLYVEYDSLFDKGYISFTDDLEVLVTPNYAKFSAQLQDKLIKLQGSKLRQPEHKPLNKEYLEYHRENIFKK